MNWLLRLLFGKPDCGTCGAYRHRRMIGISHEPGCAYFEELDRRTRKALGRIP